MSSADHFTQCCYTTTINITTMTLFNWCLVTVEQEIPLPFAVCSQRMRVLEDSEGVEDFGLSGPTPGSAPCLRHSLRKKGEETLENTLDLLRLPAELAAISSPQLLVYQSHIFLIKTKQHGKVSNLYSFCLNCVCTRAGTMTYNAAYFFFLCYILTLMLY